MRRPAVVQQPLEAAPRTIERYRTKQQPRISQGAAPQACITSMHRIATARRYQLASCPCSPPSCCARCALPPTRPTSSSKPRGCLPARERHHARNKSVVDGRAARTIVMPSSPRELDQQLWPSLKCVSLRVVSPHLGERCPGMCSVGGPSGVGHLRSPRVPPSSRSNKTILDGSKTKPRYNEYS